MRILLIFIVSISGFAAFAEPIDQNALDNTKAALLNPQQREVVIGNDKRARKADTLASITVMGNKDYKEEMYAISAELLQWAMSQQDPEKLMQQYERDPVKFLAEMPPAQAARIKALADQIEQKRKQSRAPASTP